MHLAHFLPAKSSRLRLDHRIRDAKDVRRRRLRTRTRPNVWDQSQKRMPPLQRKRYLEVGFRQKAKKERKQASNAC